MNPIVRQWEREHRLAVVAVLKAQGVYAAFEAEANSIGWAHDVELERNLVLEEFVSRKSAAGSGLAKAPQPSITAPKCGVADGASGSPTASLTPSTF